MQNKHLRFCIKICQNESKLIHRSDYRSYHIKGNGKNDILLHSTGPHIERDSGQKH